MNHQSVLELAEKWRNKAAELPPNRTPSNPEEAAEIAFDAGRRNALNQCAEELELLVKLLA